MLIWLIMEELDSYSDTMLSKMPRECNLVISWPHDTAILQ